MIHSSEHQRMRSRTDWMDTIQCTDPDLADRLTAREIEILCLMAEGCDNQTIATLLVLDRATIRTHAATVLTKS